MKRLIFLLFLLIIVSACDLFSEDEEDNNRIDFNIEPNVLINNLSNQLTETSGLIWFDDKLWSLNDSGSNNEIYALNSDGEITLTVQLEGKLNTDWEAMTQDDNYIYIGDFGNNDGNRDNLKVLKISKENLSTSENSLSVSSEEITFSYIDQTDFTVRKYQHEFDCEAMISYQDKLYLFSKDWKNFKTTVYKLPKQAGNYELTPSDSFEVNGLITGADLSSDGKYLALLGYSALRSFVYLFKFNSANTFGEKTVFLNMNSISGSQPEGITFIDDNTIAFTTEKTDFFSQQAFTINWSTYTQYLD